MLVLRNNSLTGATKMKKLILISFLSLFSLYSFSEDIELYIGNSSQQSNAKPQVLLILDTSGSMGDYQTIKNVYNPNRTYAYQGGFSSRSSNYIYYGKGSVTDLPLVDDINENRRFVADINSCKTAIDKLNTIGFYTGRIRDYTFKGNTGSWEEISSTTGETISVVDCQDDVNVDVDRLANAQSATQNVNTKILVNSGLVSLPNGYPVDGQGSADTPIYYDSDISKSNADWSGQVVTLYSDNYLRWERGDYYRDGSAIGTTTVERIDIAKPTIVNLINSIPSVDFGLQVYNANNNSNSTPLGNHGGRVVFGIQDMTADARAKLETMITTEIIPSGSTPLCESLYEAAQYFGGKPVHWGNKDTDRSSSYGRGYKHLKDSPAYDPSIITSSSYNTPYKGCSDEVFVILITDGKPTNDTAADSLIKTLTGLTSISGNHLTELARYMHTKDLNDDLSGKQISTLFTVGFSSGSSGATTLLEAAATAGGGRYFDATDPTKLGARLQQALSTILEINTTFTAPSVASNSFDKTETLDSAYYGMFIPANGASWQGNLKKLKVVNKVQVDRAGSPAIDESGNIFSTASTFWSTSATPDGNDVRQGGVVEMLSAKTSRNIYSDIGESSAIIPIDLAIAKTKYGGKADLATALGVPEDDVDDYFNWALGIDVNDADKDSSRVDIRPDVFGDPLHFKPVVINYGGSVENPDIRILVGTNSGVLHMFHDRGATVDESWAFMPKEFFSKIKKLKDNLPSSSKEYAIDGRATVHIQDVNGDGTIDASEDKVWVFFGLRRGGSTYYALDVTDKNKPKRLWTIDGDSNGFDELGQSWSQPRIGYSRLNIVGGVPKPVLIFGAGYDISKDASGAPAVDAVDSLGKGVFMVDAETGTLLWSLTPDATSAVNTQFVGITDSIPSRIGVLDSDSDGLIDRFYVGDTGGNVWRVDMPGDNPFDSSTPWSAFKLAELGGITNEIDRRFFSEPSIARTFITDTLKTAVLDEDGNATGEFSITSQEKPYDAILIGSGDRSTPTATDTNDKFFMVKDDNINTTSFLVGATSPAPVIPPVVTASDLYNFTDNPFGNYVAPLSASEKASLEVLEINVSLKSGWYYDYLPSSGEKSTAEAIAINGVAYFTSFIPGAAAGANSCSLINGSGFIYAIDMYKGRNVYNWRKVFTTVGLPDTPTLIVTKDPETTPNPDEDPDNPQPGVEAATIKLLTGGQVVDLDLMLTTSQGYLYIDENP
jgi:type IV pilus assembly protein PilY1